MDAKLTRKKINMWPFLFIGPHLAIFSVFFIFPFFFGIYISFTRWNFFGTPEFVGWMNYQTILFDNASTFYRQFWTGLGNTFTFVLLTVPFAIAVPLLLACLLTTKTWFSKLFQALFYMPSLFAVSAVMIIWSFIFSVTHGPLSQYLGITTHMLSNQPQAWISLVLVTIWWGVGGNMIIYMAAISNVSKDILESASLDGAGVMKKFFYITLPSIKYQLLFTTVMTTIAQFNVFGQPLMLTNGGPNQSTHVLLMYIQSNAFHNTGPITGIAAAMAVMLGICIMAVSLVQFFLMRDRRD